MAAISRPRRSVLYMPGSNTRALEKARGLVADGLILDLEDAVAPDAKAMARANVAAALRAGGYGRRELVVRVNGLATPWGYDDVAAAAAMKADAVLLPKVESADTVRQAETLLAAAGAPAGPRRAPTASPSSMASISISPTTRASPLRAARGASSASTARR